MIDGVHTYVNPDGSWRLSHTTDDPAAFMLLDFGNDVLISSVVIWNRLGLRSDFDVNGSGWAEQIIGCTLSAISDDGITVFSQPIDKWQDIYKWEFGRDPRKPTKKPLKKPTMKPLKKTTTKPLKKPTKKPLKKPTTKPSIKPADNPSKKPTTKPLKKPTKKPSRKPSVRKPK